MIYPNVVSKDRVLYVIDILSAIDAEAGGLRRNTELFLIFVGAIPVFLLYAMYMITAHLPNLLLTFFNTCCNMCL